jgi:autotransporter-associated beta strand protein
MKRNARIFRSTFLIAIFAIACGRVPDALADNGVWATGVSGTWHVADNWVDDTIASGVSSTATIGFTSAGQTLLITTSQTTGVINASTTAGGLTIQVAGSGELVMDNGDAQAEINITGSNSVLAGPILMTQHGLRVASLATGASTAFSLSGVSASGFYTGTAQVLSVSQAGSSVFSVSNVANSELGALAALLVERGTVGVSENTHGGGTILRNGTVRTTLSGLGTGVVTIGDASSVAGNVTLETNGAVGTFTNDIEVYNGVQTARISQYVPANSTGTPVEFSGNVLLGKTLSVLPQHGGAMKFSGVISGNGGLLFAANNGGDNTVTLSGENTFLGGVTFATGGLRLNLESASALGTGTLSFGTSMANGRQRMGLDNTSGSSLTLANNAIQLAYFTFYGSDELNLGTGAVTVGPSSAVITVLDKSLTIGGVISGAGKHIGNAGSGTLALTNANTYTGRTWVGGVLAVNSLANGGVASNIGQSTAAASNLVLNRGTLRYTGGNTSTDRLFTIGNGGATIDSSGSGDLNFSGLGEHVSTDEVTIAADSTGVVLANGLTTINVGNTSNLAVGQSISGNNIADDTVITEILDGQRIVISKAALGAASGNYVFGALDRTLTLAGTNGGNNTISGILSDSTTKKLGVTKAGSGKWILSGANTYSGATTVSEGTLVLATAGNNNIADSSHIKVEAGANLDVTGVGGGFTLAAGQTLEGNGNVLGDFSVAANSTLSPGNSPGALNHVGTQSWLDGGNYNWQIHDATGLAGVGYDTVIITGSLNLTGLTGPESFNINLWSLSSIGPDVNGDAINFDPFASQSWTLVTTSAGIVGFDASEFTINTGAFNGTGGFTNDAVGSFALQVVGNDLVLSYSVIPEPGSVALLLSGVGMFLLLNRRGRRA